MTLDRLTAAHARRLTWWVAGAIGVVMPALIGAWIVLGHALDWGPIHTARVANVGGIVVLTALIFGPLTWRRFPRDERLRGFVLAWFVISPFFNLVWQLPLILFREKITGAEVTMDNLPRYISWWGYGSADEHYRTVSSFMIASELGWLVVMLVGIAGLVAALRGRARAGYLLMGISGALQAYNASFYLLENGIVDHYDNVASDSPLALVLYVGFGVLWPAAALTASASCFRLLRAEGPLPKPGGSRG
jgi:hypothetical protein